MVYPFTDPFRSGRAEAPLRDGIETWTSLWMRPFGMPGGEGLGSPAALNENMRRLAEMQRQWLQAWMALWGVSLPGPSCAPGKAPAAVDRRVTAEPDEAVLPPVAPVGGEAAPLPALVPAATAPAAPPPKEASAAPAPAGKAPAAERPSARPAMPAPQKAAPAANRMPDAAVARPGKAASSPAAAPTAPAPGKAAAPAAPEGLPPAIAEALAPKVALKPAVTKILPDAAARPGAAMPPTMPLPDGPADDLAQLKGVGAKVAGMLNDIGIWHFRQIAAWTPAEADWVANKLGLRGRYRPEQWIESARAMAKG